MEIQHLVLEVKHLLAQFNARLEGLVTSIVLDTGYAFYQTDNLPALVGADAREAICQHLSNNHWKVFEPNNSGPNKENHMAAVACSEQTLALAAELNRAKKSFEIKHISIRKSILERRGQSQKTATEVFRQQILNALGEKLLNLDAVDRQVPIFNQPATRITWLFNTTSASQRKTIADAKAVLIEWMAAAGDDRHKELTDELDSLDQYPEDTAVAFRNRKPVTSLKFRATSKLPGTQAIHYADYGRNPVLFLNEGTEPLLRLPPEITGQSKIKRKGRPKTISDQNVSPSLKSWFWYNGANPPITASASAAIEDTGEGNFLGA